MRSRPNGSVVMPRRRPRTGWARFAAVRQVGDGGEWLVGRKPWPGEMTVDAPAALGRGKRRLARPPVAPPRRVAGSLAAGWVRAWSLPPDALRGRARRDGFNGPRSGSTTWLRSGGGSR